MLKNICLLFFFTVFFFNSNAQENLNKKRHAEIQKTLGMNDIQYKNFNDSLKVYDGKLATLLKDKSVGDKERGAAMSRILTERRSYLQRQLSEDQCKKLDEINRRYAPISPRHKQKKELEERLRTKGINTVNNAG